MQTQETTNDLLSIETYFVRAETGKRFLNYVIDIIVFYVLAFGITILLIILTPSFFQSIAESQSRSSGLLDNILSFAFYALYMSITEAIFKGRSLGKLITKTRAVNLDGSSISTSTAFARGFSRAVPFSAFSAFGTPSNPWQDKWTNTMVIDVKKSDLN